MQKKTNSLAVGAFVISIIGLFINLWGIIPIVAILFSISALIYIRDSGEEGKGVATVALILGIAGIVLTVLRFTLCFVLIDNFSL